MKQFKSKKKRYFAVLVVLAFFVTVAGAMAKLDVVAAPSPVHPPCPLPVVIPAEPVPVPVVVESMRANTVRGVSTKTSWEFVRYETAPKFSHGKTVRVERQVKYQVHTCSKAQMDEKGRCNVRYTDAYRRTVIFA